MKFNPLTGKIENASTTNVGGNAFFEYEQVSSATVWTVNHNLGFKPNIAVRTTGGVVFDAEILHVNNNQAIITLTTNLAGFVTCS